MYAFHAIRAVPTQPSAAPRPTLRRRRGTTAIEFALVMPVLLSLSFGILDYSWYFMSVQGAMNAAHQGVRSGSQVALWNDPAGAAQQAATIVLETQYPAQSMPVVCEAEVLDESRVVVTVTLTFEPLVGFVPTPSGFTAKAERLLEQHMDEE